MKNLFLIGLLVVVSHSFVSCEADSANDNENSLYETELQKLTDKGEVVPPGSGGSGSGDDDPEG